MESLSLSSAPSEVVAWFRTCERAAEQTDAADEAWPEWSLAADLCVGRTQSPGERRPMNPHRRAGSMQENAFQTRSGREHAAVWRWLGGQAPGWWSGHVAFRGPKRVIVVGGTRWAVHFNIHANRRSLRAKKLYLSAMLSVLPEGVTRVETHRLMRSGWFRAFKQHVAAYGYGGGWRDSRWGRSAVFVKELAGLADVKAEVRRVREYDLSVAARQ